MNRTSPPPPPGRRGRATSVMWLWASPEASHALRSRNLGVIPRAYRWINRLSQERLAALLGYDKTYISMIETRRRVISDVATLRHIAHTLAIPVHVLGVSEPDDATYKAMVQFADSILNLADIARQAGRATDAIAELWPLVARLEARAAEGIADRDTLALLGRARVALGIALGTVLPEEKLSAAARWTGQALLIAQRLDQPAALAHALAMHGNELRKAGHLPAAVTRLRAAVATSTEIPARVAASAMLARAAGEAGHAELFDTSIDAYRRLLDQANNQGDCQPDGSGMFDNPFTLREIQLRGLVGTGRASAAVQLMTHSHDNMPAAPQWAVIEHVTTGQVLLAIGDHQSAQHALSTAITRAETHQLPHQIQRAVRLAGDLLPGTTDQGRAALVRLNQQLARLP